MAYGWEGGSLYCDKAAVLAVVPMQDKGGPAPWRVGRKWAHPLWSTKCSEVDTGSSYGQVDSRRSQYIRTPKDMIGILAIAQT